MEQPRQWPHEMTETYHRDDASLSADQIRFLALEAQLKTNKN